MTQIRNLPSAGGTISSSDVLVGNISGVTSRIPFSTLQSSVLSSLADTSSTANGDALIGVKLNAVGSVALTQHDKNAEIVSVLDFGPARDGVTDDSVPIQYAVTAAAALGKPLYIPAGTYVAQNISLTCSLRGEGTLKLKAAATKPLLILAASGLTIEGITLDGNRANQTATLTNDIAGKATIALVTNITVPTDTPTYNTITNYRIRNATLQNSLQSAIIIKADTDFQEVSGCRFTKIVQPLWYVIAASNTAVPPQTINAAFVDNDVYDTGESITGTEWGDGIVIGRSSKVLISNNRFRKMLRDALYFDAVQGLSITDNIFESISWNAVQFQPTALSLNESFNGGLLISNNTFRQIGLSASNNVAISLTGSTTSTGKTFDYGSVQISNNVLHDPYSASVTIGIQVLSNKYRNVLIDSNNVRSHLYAIQINSGSSDQGPSDVTISNNVISSTNNISVFLTGTAFVTGASRARIVISNNRIFDSGAQGVLVGADIARQLHVTNNTIQGGVQEAILLNSGATVDGGLLYGNHCDAKAINSNITGLQWGDNYTSGGLTVTAGTEFAPRYAVGTFNATLTTTGTDFTSVTYSNQSCRYIRIGALVYIQGRITTSAVTIGSANGNIAIGNLPFTPVASSVGGNGRSAINVGYTSGWGTNAPSHGFLNNSTAKVALFYLSTANGVSQSTAASVGGDVSATSNDIMFNLQYYTSD